MSASKSKRVAIITGASRGLGAVVARVVAERQHDLVLGARDVASLNRVAGSLRALGAHVLTVEGDIADGRTRARLVAAARSLGGLDLLVNNASELGGIGPLLSFDMSGKPGGSGKSGRPARSGKSGRPGKSGRQARIHPTHPTDLTHLAHPTDLAHPTHLTHLTHLAHPTHPTHLTDSAHPTSGFLRVLQVNVIAPVALVQLALPLLVERHGLIVNISSDAAHGAYPGWGPYGASKAALEMVTRTLAAELREHSVSAVIVDPGDMRTRMHQEAFPDQDISDRPLPDVTVPFWAWLFDQQPLDRTGARFAAQQEDRRWLQPA